MKTSVVALLAFLATMLMSCDRSSPVEAVPALEGRWVADAHGVRLDVLLAQNGEAVSGSGFLFLADPYQLLPVSVSGVCLFPKVSLAVDRGSGSVTNLSGSFQNDSTIFVLVRSDLLAPSGLTLVRSPL